MKLKKWFIHMKDYELNTIAFGLYITMQQLVIMPILSKATDDFTLSKIILFISIFNIICNVIGDELGNTRLVRYNIYKEKRIDGDFHVILLVSMSICFLACIFMNFFLKTRYTILLLYILITLLGIVRYFSITYYKLKQRFANIIIMNATYCLGALVGICFAIRLGFYFAPFLLGEIFSFIYIIIMIFIDSDQRPTLVTTIELNNSIKMFAQLSTVSLLVNSMAYLDRIIIFPMLGSAAMATYYSVTTMSKMLLLIINPISGVILAKLNNVSDAEKRKIISIIVRLLFPVFIIFTIGSIFMSYYGVKLLYVNYISNVNKLLLPIGIATSLSMISFLLKPFIMRFFSTKKFLYINFLYATVFLISIYFFSTRWGIVGFAWASCLAQLVQCLSFSLILIKSCIFMEEINLC